MAVDGFRIEGRDARRGQRLATVVVLVLEAASFAAAAAIHAGVYVGGHEHGEAQVAETVIAGVLLVAAALAWAPHPWPWRFAVAGQAFAFLGVLVGLFTIAIGIGPRTVGDVVYHLAMLPLLAAGAILASRPLRSGTRGLR